VQKYKEPDLLQEVDLVGKVFIVTDAHSDLGKAVVTALAARNAEVYMVCPDSERAEKAKAWCASGAWILAHHEGPKRAEKVSFLPFSFLPSFLHSFHLMLLPSFLYVPFLPSFLYVSFLPLGRKFTRPAGQLKVSFLDLPSFLPSSLTFLGLPAVWRRTCGACGRISPPIDG
jgi:hypothetical protein